MTTMSRNRSSITSTSSAGRRSTVSSEGDFPEGTSQRRLSSIPRATMGQSNSKPTNITTSKPLPPYLSARKPVPSSTTSPPRSRPAQGIGQGSSRMIDSARIGYAVSPPSLVEAWRGTSKPIADNKSSNRSALLDRGRPPRPAIVPPDDYERDQETELPPRLIPELQALAASTARAASAQPPSLSSISSPSTLFTESPGTWSSRNTTPTSMSSYSPGIVPSLKPSGSGKRSNTVPIAATASKSLPRLPALPETLQSGSNSVNYKSPQSTKSKPNSKKKKILDSPAPTPPPRASSVKHKTSRTDTIAESLAVSQTPPRRQKLAPQSDNSPLHQKSSRVVNRVGESWDDKPVVYTSASSHVVPIVYAPSRPSRDGVDDLELRRPLLADTTLLASQRDGGRQKAAVAATIPVASVTHLPPSATEMTGIHSLQQPYTSTLARPSYSSAPASRVRTPVSDGEDHTRDIVRPSTSGRFSPSTGRRMLSKLSLFSWSPKIQDGDSPRKLRKGPAAGTGHEGYGRFTRRGRKSSMESSQTESTTDRSESSREGRRTPLRSRKQSVSSRKDRSSQSDLDDFASQRLRPRVIKGGSGQNEREEQPTTPRLAPSLPIDEPSRLRSPGRGGHYPPIPDSPLSYVTSASSSFSIPAPVSTASSKKARRHNDIFGPGSMRSTTVSQSSLASSVPAFVKSPVSRHEVQANISPKQEKKPRRLRWNIFSRSTTPSKQEKMRSDKAASPPKMAVRVSAGRPPRSIPYYAMMDSESEYNIHENLGDFISQAVAPTPRMRTPEPPETELDGHVPIMFDDQYHSQQFYPPTETAFYQPPPIMDPTPTATMIASPKKRRLAAVGRIPRVVSRKGRFSGRNSSDDSLDTPASHFGKSSTNVHDERQFMGRREFIHFPSKHNSDVSASSSSTGLYSSSGPVGFQTAASGGMGRQYTGEEEVWNEYDDFLDHVMSPSSSQRHLPPLADGPNVPSPTKASQNLARVAAKKSSAKQLRHNAPTLPLPTTNAIAEARSREELRLRRSQIVSALHSSLDPSSPFTIADYLSENGDWLRYSAKLSDRQSTSSPENPAIPLPPSLDEKDKTPLRSEQTQQHNAVLLDAVARTRNPAAQSELHLASLMISRWLSFGRVLFSPAHDEVSIQAERHILVLDGLGSADWSIFCSVTYSSQRTFVHDLKERDGRHPYEPEHAPPNYRRTEIRSLCDQFPFPPSFFTAVVLRFPPAMSDRQLRNIITECKRVLAPGGFLELMLLDLDVVSMGGQTRRAVRDLKIRITSEHRAISLKPLSDNIQSHIGQQGFPRLSRCVVGVPVAGKASGSGDSSSSSRSSGDSYVKAQRSRDAANQSGSPTHRRSHRDQGHNFSLSDLVADHSENADAKIGRMVSRTARSWWQHCFEASIIPDGDLSRSIFADKSLIRECKARGSSFKLLIAYTQNPGENKRRTMSESGLATLATAGPRTKRT